MHLDPIPSNKNNYKAIGWSQVNSCPMRPLPFLDDKCILYWFLFGEQIVNFDFGIIEVGKRKISAMRRDKKS